MVICESWQQEWRQSAPKKQEESQNMRLKTKQNKVDPPQTVNIYSSLIV